MPACTQLRCAEQDLIALDFPAQSPERVLNHQAEIGRVEGYDQHHQRAVHDHQPIRNPQVKAAWNPLFRPRHTEHVRERR